MNNGIKLRFIIHNILYEIYKNNKNFDSKTIQKKINHLSQRDISFINTVCLNSMRYYFHSKKILKMYSKEKQKINEEILLISAITQIIFLDFKSYAVTNSSVEISKKIKIYHGFVNALLKKISLDKNKLKEIKLDFSDLPDWFKKNTKNLTKNEKDIFLNNFSKKPNLHMVFKNEIDLNNLKETIIKTSNTSGFLKEEKKISLISNFQNGRWWIQDFSSSLPLNNIPKEILSKDVIDV